MWGHAKESRYPIGASKFCHWDMPTLWHSWTSFVPETGLELLILLHQHYECLEFFNVFKILACTWGSENSVASISIGMGRTHSCRIFLCFLSLKITFLCTSESLMVKENKISGTQQALISYVSRLFLLLLFHVYEINWQYLWEENI